MACWEKLMRCLSAANFVISTRLFHSVEYSLNGNGARVTLKSTNSQQPVRQCCCKYLAMAHRQQQLASVFMAVTPCSSTPADVPCKTDINTGCAACAASPSLLTSMLCKGTHFVVARGKH